MTRDEYLSVLGLSSNATAEEVEAAYADLMQVWDASRFEANERLLEKSRLKIAELEEAVQYLRLDPVIQARKEHVTKRTEEPSKEFPSESHILSAAELSLKTPETEQELFSVLPFLKALAITTLIISCLAFLTFKLCSAAAPKAENSDKVRLEQEEWLRALSQEIKQQLRENRSVDEQPISAVLPSSADKSPAYPESKREEATAAPSPIPTMSESDTVAATELPREEQMALRAELDKLPEKHFKDKDRLYTLSKTEPVKESFINYTPDLLDSAISCDEPEVTRLLNNGANVNTVDDRGDSALSWAVRTKCVPVVRLLLRRGANVNSTSQNGFTPYVWARIYRSEVLEKLLREAGADTKKGAYWWRDHDDSREDWLKQQLDYACANKDCSRHAISERGGR